MIKPRANKDVKELREWAAPDASLPHRLRTSHDLPSSAAPRHYPPPVEASTAHHRLICTTKESLCPTLRPTPPP